MDAKAVYYTNMGALVAGCVLIVMCVVISLWTRPTARRWFIATAILVIGEVCLGYYFAYQYRHGYIGYKLNIVLTMTLFFLLAWHLYLAFSARHRTTLAFLMQAVMFASVVISLLMAFLWQPVFVGFLLGAVLSAAGYLVGSQAACMGHGFAARATRMLANLMSIGGALMMAGLVVWFYHWLLGHNVDKAHAYPLTAILVVVVLLLGASTARAGFRRQLHHNQHATAHPAARRRVF